MIGIERRFSDDTRLIDLTVGDLKVLVKSLIPESKPTEELTLVCGLEGIAKLFNCSKSSAYRLKRSGKIDKAIVQEGQKIIVDVNLALELLKRTKR